MLELIPTLVPYISAAAGVVGTIGVQVIQKMFFSPKEKKEAKREDFIAITDTLFAEIANLRHYVDSYKEDARACENKYSELQSKFMDFKQKHNELDLRYKIQVSLNRKISDEVRKLEIQVQAHLDKEKSLFNESDEEIPPRHT